MRFEYRIAVGCEDLGRRVTVRFRTEGGALSDVLGVLEACDDATFQIRDRAGRLRRVDRERVVAAKVVPPPKR